MHREEVIKEAEKRLSSVSFQLESGGNLNAGLRKIKEREYKFLRGVVFALRAQQTAAKLDRSRWEGCNYCNKYGIVLAAFDGWSYCNCCGRPLTEAAWAETERRIST